MIKPLNFGLLLLVAAACALSSCSSMSKVTSRVKVPKLKAPSLKMPKFKKPNLSKMALLNPKNFSWADLKAGKRVPIVEVREKDLKKTKTGEQLYLAYNRKKKSYGYYSNGGKVFTPVDFDPGQLPEGEGGDIPSYGLLPALTPGGNSAAIGSGSLSDLPPVDLPEVPSDLALPEDFGVPGTTPPASVDPAPAFLESAPVPKLNEPTPIEKVVPTE